MKTIVQIVGAIVVVVGLFFVFNAYIYDAKQSRPGTLVDGEYLGFVEALTDNNTRMDFDGAEWLTGVEGENAAIEAGICTEETRSECLPNNFFIKNAERKNEWFAIGPDVLIS